MRASDPEQRFDLGEVGEDQFALLGHLPVVVGCSALDPVEHHVGGRAQEDDGIELRVEPALVGHRPGHVESHLATASE